MLSEQVHVLVPDVLEFFARKGLEGGAQVSQTGNANGVKVRRITQLLRDLTQKTISELTVLDLACGEGVYAIEAALRGARVVAIDGRTERMDHGATIAARLGLSRLTFEQNDVRKVTVDSHGEFDVVYLLGILYHLDVPDLCHVLEQLVPMCREWLIIDTHISLDSPDSFAYGGHRYSGKRVREHADDDSQATRQANVLMSLDNTFSFQFDRPSLIRLLVDTGFTTVLECLAPLEPAKPPNRITLAARRGRTVLVSTYPWVNGKTEDQIASYVTAATVTQESGPKPAGGVRALINQTLGRFGYEIRRVGRVRPPTI